MPTTHQPVNAQINALVGAFVQNVYRVVEDDFKSRVLSSVGVTATRGPGRPSKNASSAFIMSALRKKAPKQLCPVPGCKNPAAPVYNMVCAKHKDTPKAKIKAYREKRRAANKKK